MGWTVLYIAFGIVALWLLGEVLLQYKARLRWRLLAFGGFSLVVAGVVALSSIVVIALGAVTFAVGQTFVTLSYRRGFSTGWALGGMPGSSRRRRDGDEPDEGFEDGYEADPVRELSGVEKTGPYGPGEPDAYGAQDAYGQSAYGQSHETPEPPAHAPQPQPLPDETGEYGIHDRGGPAPYAPAAAHQDPAGDPYGTGYGQGYDTGYGAEYGQQEQHQYAPYADQYGYDSGSYAATASYDAYGNGAAAGYGGHDGGYGGAGHDAGTQGYDSGYGGAWVPQQRDVAPQQYGYGDGGGYGAEYGEQGYGYGYPYAGAGYDNGNGSGNGHGNGQENGAGQGYGNGNGYANGYDAGTQGYDTAAGGYNYDDERGC